MGVKALLAQSPATSPWVPRRQWEPPSAALSTIAAQTDGHDVRGADMVVWRKRAPSRFLETLEQFRPRVVGFSAMTRGEGDLAFGELLDCVESNGEGLDGVLGLS